MWTMGRPGRKSHPPEVFGLVGAWWEVWFARFLILLLLIRILSSCFTSNMAGEWEGEGMLLLLFFFPPPGG